MKEAYWGYWLIVLGVFIIIVLLLVQSFTSTNTQDHVLVKNITEAAMLDAVDYAYYRTYGEVKINKEKFYEVFLRRFAEEASLVTNYTIEFYDVYEAPPKVGVKVSSKSSTFAIAGDTTTFDIVNKLDAIIESSVIDGTSSEIERSSWADIEYLPNGNPVEYYPNHAKVEVYNNNYNCSYDWSNSPDESCKAISSNTLIVKACESEDKTCLLVSTENSECKLVGVPYENSDIICEYGDMNALCTPK